MKLKKINIFNKLNVLEYKNLLNKFNLNLDIYYQPNYLKIESTLVKGEFEIFTINNKNKIFIYPYIKVGFDNEFSKYKDLISPYGYAGPFCNDTSFFKVGESEFIEYIKKENIVSEFVRYHFLYNKNLRFSNNILNEHNRTNVIIDLRKEWNEILMNEVAINNRNYLNKLEKDKFVFEICKDEKSIEEFRILYNQTMKNVKADKSFFFNSAYFKKLFKGLKKNVKLARIVKNKTTYAGVIFFISGDIVELFLNCRNLKHQKISSTSALYLNIAKWAQSKGVKYLNLGGGITKLPTDPLFKFKKKLSKTYLPFYIGKRIHNKIIYKKIIDQYIKYHGEKKYKNNLHKLQFYR